MPEPTLIYIVWSATGPIAAYGVPVPAAQHANVMLGVQVSILELRDRLPENVADDINSDYDGDDDTPVVDLADIDDG